MKLSLISSPPTCPSFTSTVPKPSTTRQLPITETFTLITTLTHPFPVEATEPTSSPNQLSDGGIGDGGDD
ncbi:hypothetical protein V6N13_013425 [Hibiscus sabdariffa]|uniref:Uncharacterized protein n=1 Tax=Hibiscus sabdariffa TaxID=183260 RepID=A0ABR2BV54_9ROSI